MAIGLVRPPLSALQQQPFAPMPGKRLREEWLRKDRVPMHEEARLRMS